MLIDIEHYYTVLCTCIHILCAGVWHLPTPCLDCVNAQGAARWVGQQRLSASCVAPQRSSCGSPCTIQLLESSCNSTPDSVFSLKIRRFGRGVSDDSGWRDSRFEYSHIADSVPCRNRPNLDFEKSRYGNGDIPIRRATFGCVYIVRMKIRDAAGMLQESLAMPTKPEQLDVVEAFVKGRDVFAVLPTGYGKSLCGKSLCLVAFH